MPERTTRDNQIWIYYIFNDRWLVSSSLMINQTQMNV